ncbi:MAG: winged helix-turn-helix domain-containing protein [Anaerolineae bacterium]|nr:winged helix-turn-helix domain-containing protein [Thermoflexales bacterium]MDW8406179.1 winged helix-turn-helix domain-containing protein [Anaerolineae bacterium]
MIREQELRALLSAVRAAECASVIGLSNTGKSTLLRAVCSSAVRRLVWQQPDERWLFVYVDCNLMPERSERALHEIVLRNVIEALRQSNTTESLLSRLNVFRQQVVQPPTPLRSALAFNEALTVLCEDSGRRIVLALDEFDDPFEKLDGRVFLNLRASKDRFGDNLTFVTATDRPLSEIRADYEASEFVELFAAQTHWIGFLNAAQSRELVWELARADDFTLESDEVDFLVHQAGGHPGLLKSIVQIYGRVAAGAPKSAQREAQSVAAYAFDADATVHQECLKLWTQLTVPERDTLMALFGHGRVNEQALDQATLTRLRLRNLLPCSPSTEDSSAPDTGPAVGALWQSFIKRQALSAGRRERGVRVDVEAGDVYVDGRPIETLTELEYKLLLLLYGRLNKIVDKYTIVTEVWGENYLNEVDDARIEKLVSRLRAKLEPGAPEPVYLLTVRGRGYKLVG